MGDSKESPLVRARKELALGRTALATTGRGLPVDQAAAKKQEGVAGRSGWSRPGGRARERESKRGCLKRILQLSSLARHWARDAHWH